MTGMTVASPPMSNPQPSALLRVIEEHGARLLRYCGVSAVNVLTGMSTLAFCHAVLGWSPVASSVSAWAVSTIPAYLLSRHWVWQQSGSHSMSAEIMPFWILALAGLAFSTLVVGLVGTVTDSTLVILLGNLGAYGVVWVVKYLVIDNLMWSHEDSDHRVEAAEAI